MSNDEDRKAAEDKAIEWCGYLMPTTEEDRYLLLKHEVPPEYVGMFLAGIEYERKRQFDIRAEASVIEYKRDSQLIEQVGEKHWRIKDGHE
jgi:hypothetical protein